MPKLGFGKHADEELEEVPAKYLQWLIDSSMEKVTMCRDELERRQSKFDNSWMVKIVTNGYLEVAKTATSPEDQVRLEKARQLLLKAITEAATPSGAST